MNLYFLGILAALVVFFAVGIGAGRMVKDTNDYYVSGRNAPTLLIVGSLIASFLSTGAFLGDTGEVYSGFFIGIVTVGVIQALHRDGLYLRRRVLRPVHPPERGDDAAGVFRPPLLLEAPAPALGRDFACVCERVPAQCHSGRVHAHEQHHRL